MPLLDTLKIIKFNTLLDLTQLNTNLWEIATKNPVRQITNNEITIRIKELTKTKLKME